MRAKSPKDSLTPCTPFFTAAFGCNYAWICICFFNNTHFNPLALADYNLVSMTALVVMLLVIWRNYQRMHAMLGSKVFISAIGIAQLIGTILIYCTDAGGQLGQTAFLASAILTGLASPFVLMVLGCLLTREEKAPFIDLGLAYLLGTILFSCISLLFGYYAVLVSGVLPMLSLVTAIRGNRTLDAVSTTTQPAEAETDAKKTAVEFLPSVCVAAVFFGIALGFCNSLPESSYAGYYGTSYVVYFFLSNTIPLIALLGYYFLSEGTRSQEDSFANIYRVALLLMVTALLLVNIGQLFGGLLPLIAVLGYTCFKMLLWALFAHISRLNGVHPIRVFSIGEACITGGLLIGKGITRAYSACFPLTPTASALILAVATMLLLTTYIFVLNERKIIAIVSIGSKDTPHVVHRFQERCSSIAGQYGLTNRETEVFTQFARGRSSSRIADDLYLSTSTVTTYLRSIYRKLDVHSRQELLDLFEENTNDHPRQEPESEK